MIQILSDRATPDQMQTMLEALGIYVKLVVDIERRILAGGGELHVDCEKILLRNGSRQVDLWGVDWYPFNQTIGYESIINIRVSANNRSMKIQDLGIRSRVDEIVYLFLGGVQWQSIGTL